MSKKSKTKSGNLGRALIKNRFGHQFRRKRHYDIRLASDGSLVSASPTEKPWRSVKKERREKLRKKFSHLDKH